MKRIILLVTAGLLVFALAACDFGTGSVSTPPASDYQDEASAQDAADMVRNNAAFFVNAVNPGTVDNEEDQEIRIDFSNGVADSAAVSGNITLYPLDDAGEAFQAWERGTALSYTANVIDDLDGSSTVVLSFDGTGLSTGALELVVSSALTANGGARQLNTDNDDIPGEDEDDDVRYITVNNAAGVADFNAAPTGTQRQPRDKFDVNLYEDSGLTEVFDNVFTQSTVPSALYMEFVSPDGQTGSDYDGYVQPTSDVVQLYKLEGTQYSPVSATFSRESAGVWSMTPQGGFEDEAFYFVGLSALWQETKAWNGYVHRFNAAALGGTNTTNDDSNEPLVFEQIAVNTDGDEFSIAGGDTMNAPVFVADEGYVSAGYVEVTFSPTGTLSAASNVADLVELVIDPDTAEDGDEREIPVTSVTKVSDNVYRFNFGSLGKADTGDFDLTSTDNEVSLDVFLGAFIDDNGTPDDGTDDQPYTASGGVIEFDDSSGWGI